MLKKYVNWARVHENKVTHLVQAYENWPEMNPWTRFPGEWIKVEPPVSTEWNYDPTTKTFSPPNA